MKKPSQQLINTVKAMAEIYGKTMTDAAALVYLGALADMPEKTAQTALQRCLRELRQFPTVADVLARAQALDGRPGVEQAWAMLPKGEDETVVWTDEMAAAYSVCRRLIDAGDMMAARMTFKEVYTERVQAARDAGQPPRWSPTLGNSKELRRAAIEEAVRIGRLSEDQALKLLSEMTAQEPRLRMLVSDVTKALPLVGNE